MLYTLRRGWAAQSAVPPGDAAEGAGDCYATGVFSSRRIAAKLVEDVLRVLAAGNRPDFRTINRFRQQHLETFGELFVEVVRLARRMGLVKLGTVALDGTKVRANASKHKAMSYERMQAEERRLSKRCGRCWSGRNRSTWPRTSGTEKNAAGTSCRRSYGGGSNGWRRSGRRSGRWRPSKRGRTRRGDGERGTARWLDVVAEHEFLRMRRRR